MRHGSCLLLYRSAQYHMSSTFKIACMPSKVYLWIGQGANISEDMRTLYSTAEHNEMFKRFLNNYIDQELRFFCSDTNCFHLEDGWRDFEDLGE